jgi:hypothetical protein
MKELGLHGASLDGMVGTTPVLDLEETPEKPAMVKPEPAQKPKAAPPKAPDNNAATENAE